MAIAMHARTVNGGATGVPYGATESEALAAVKCATGRKSRQPDQKYKACLLAGRYVLTGGKIKIGGKMVSDAHIPMRGGVQPVAIGLAEDKP